MSTVENKTKNVEAANCDKRRDFLPEYHDLKTEGLWFYYDYYKPGKRVVEIVLDGREYLIFSTNNYLGLSRNPNVIKAAIGAVGEFGVGSGASYAVTGGSIYHRDLEMQLASFYGYEAGLLLSSGYMANSAVVTSLVDSDTVFFCDKYIHASFRNSFKLHGINPIRYEHDDVADLSTKLRSHQHVKSRVIITESLFSQHGTIARIDQLSAVARSNGALLVVDDAHGLGTIGANGGGVLSYYSMNANDVTIITGAMNKALGAMGGFVVASRKFIEQIKMRSHELIFTSSLPAVIVAAASAALHEIRFNHGLYEKLHENMNYFREQMSKNGFAVPKDVTPIVPLFVGGIKKACLLSKSLRDDGIIAIPIIPPAVAPDSCLIRFQITAEHMSRDIDRLISILRKDGT